MQSHFHLLVETLLGNLADFMRHFNITYTSFFNRQHKRVGHLYQGRYKSILGDTDFVARIQSEFLETSQIREQSSARPLKQYQQQTVILAAIEKETGLDLAAIIKDLTPLFASS
jgi:hypothetical protein